MFNLHQSLGKKIELVLLSRFLAETCDKFIYAWLAIFNIELKTLFYYCENYSLVHRQSLQIGLWGPITKQSPE